MMKMPILSVCKAGLLFLASLLLQLAFGSVHAAESPIAIIGGTIIDGNGGPPIENGVVVVRGNTIAAVGAKGQTKVPDGAHVIDAKGMSILPGLADMHTHLVGGWDGLSIDMLGYQRFLNALLYAGVTTVLDTGNVMPFVLQMRDEIAAGTIAGPRIYSVGALVDGPDTVWPPIAVVAASATQMPGIVAMLDNAGVDAIKAYASLSVPMLQELVRVASELSLPVIADLWSRNGSYDVAATGISAFAHLPSRDFDPAALDLISERGIKFITTLAVKESFAMYRLHDLSFLDQPLIADTSPANFDAALRQYATRTLTESDQAQVKRFQHSLAVAQASVPVLKKAGVTMVAGTDAPYPGVMLGEGLHRELELLVEAGLTPLEAISAATRNAAGLMGADDWGTLEAGKRADLIVVTGRPDRHIGDTRNIQVVMQKGHILDRKALKLDPKTDPGFSAGIALDKSH